MEIKNLELLAKAGLEAVTDNEGNVTIQEKEEVLENGGKWLPNKGETYFAVLELGIESEPYEFSSFRPDNEFEKRHLKCGTVFQTMEMAKRVTEKYIAAINDEWEEYEKKINALNREKDESED
jgi:hypothetical protein